MQKKCAERMLSVLMIFTVLIGVVSGVPVQRALADTVTPSMDEGLAAQASSGEDFSIVPDRVVFDKNAEQRHDVFVKIPFKEEHLKGIRKGDYRLTRGTDYDIEGHIGIIKKEYLSGLEEGEQQFTFEFDAQDIGLELSIIDSSLSTAYIKVDANDVTKAFDTNPVALVSFYMTSSDEKPIFENRVQTFSEAVAEMGISAMRFPYGHLSNNYLWTTDPFNPVDENGRLMPRLASIYSKPSPLVDRETWGWLVNDDGTFDKSMDFDEYISICKANNIEPLVVINILSKTYKEGPTEDELLDYAVEWVRYANKRKGYGVKYWQIGNEAENHGKKISLSEYKRIYKRFAEAMKVVDDIIHIGTSFNYSRHWMDSFHSEPDLKPLIDFTAAHQYTFSHSWAKNYETWRDNIGAGQGNVNHIVASVKNHIPGTPIFITESNVVGGSWENMDNEMYKALAWFDMLLSTISKENIKYSFFWTSHNAWRGKDNFNNHAAALDTDNSLLPKGQILKLTSHHLEDQLVYAERVKGHLRTYATHCSATEDLTVFLLNKGDQPVETEVFLGGYHVTEVSERGVFKGKDAWDTAPEYIQTAVGEVDLNQDADALTTTLDPVSLTVIKLKGTNISQSNDADLSGLSFHSGILSSDFDAGITAYDLTIESSIKEIRVTPTAAAASSAVKINGASVKSGSSHTVSNINDGDVLEIEVIAEDGTIKTYRIHIVNRRPRLDDIVFWQGKPNNPFAPDITSYTLKVNYSDAVLDIAPVITDVFERMTVNGRVVNSNEKTTIDLAFGNNFIDIVITQPDGLQNAYIVNAYRPATPDTNASLSNIEVSEGTLLFDPSVENYTMSVANNITALDIIATTASDAAALTVNGESKNSGEAYTVTLAEGVTVTVNIVVTAEDQTTKTYSVDITRLAPSIDEGLVVHYKFDESDGIIAKDSSGSGNDGTLSQGARWTAGKVGGAVDLDGIDDYISLNNPLGSDARELTFSAWLYLDQKNGTTLQSVISQEGSMGVVWLFRSERPGVENRFQSWLLSGNQSVSKAECPVGQWVHVTYVYSHKANESKIYINGVLDSIAPVHQGQRIYTGKLRIGAHKNPDAAREEWDGKVDDLRIYDRPLTAAEVRMLYEY